MILESLCRYYAAVYLGVPPATWLSIMSWQIIILMCCTRGAKR